LIIIFEVPEHYVQINEIETGWVKKHRVVGLIKTTLLYNGNN